MIVRMRDKGNGVTSLHIGTRNVRRYFVKSISTVDLDLDSLQIRCELAQDFWNGHPEIVDPRLCSWLAAKDCSWKVSGKRMVLSLLPAGENSFRIQPLLSSAMGRQASLPTSAA